jgi:hypothetical protein
MSDNQMEYILSKYTFVYIYSRFPFLVGSPMGGSSNMGTCFTFGFSQNQVWMILVYPLVI